MKVYAVSVDINLHERKVITGAGRLIEFLKIIRIKVRPEGCTITLDPPCVIKCTNLEIT